VKTKQELMRRLGQVNADIELDLRRLQDFDGKNMTRDEGLGAQPRSPEASSGHRSALLADVGARG